MMLPPDVCFRRARVEEAALLADFAGRLFRQTYLPVCPPADVEAYAAEHFFAARQHAELSEPACRVVFAFAGEVLAGYAQLRAGAAPACVELLPAVEVVRFYVDAPWQGSGLAPQLMEVCRQEARPRARALWLGVWQQNTRAIRFYERSGFRAVGTHPFVMGEDVQDDLVMACPLDP